MSGCQEFPPQTAAYNSLEQSSCNLETVFENTWYILLTASRVVLSRTGPGSRPKGHSRRTGQSPGPALALASTSPGCRPWDLADTASAGQNQHSRSCPGAFGSWLLSEAGVQGAQSSTVEDEDCGSLVVRVHAGWVSWRFEV